jgi:hypothetical protein
LALSIAAMPVKVTNKHRDISFYMIRIPIQTQTNIQLNIYKIKTKQLQWSGHVQKMEEGRLPKEVMKWRSPRRRKRGRPKLTWAEGIRGLMEKRD